MSTNQRTTDYVLFLYFIILLFVGLVMLASASSPLGFSRFGDSYFFIKRQFLFGFLPGIFLFLFFAKCDYHRLKKISLPFFVLCIIGLLLVFFPGIGSNLNTGSKSWLLVADHSFQPAELAKLGMIIFLAALLTKKAGDIRDYRKGFLPVLGLGLIPIVLVVLQPDVGTVAILFAILFGLLFVAQAKFYHLSALALFGVAMFLLLIAIAPYRAARLTTFLHPELDPQGIGYHINQAFLAIGSGGFFGLGLGHSRQKFQYLPEVHSDSIFAVVAEEMGFFFSAGFLVLLLLISYRCFMLAKHTPDRFGRYLVSGITIWFMVQSFFNIGAMVGLMPITGVPLPFVSHGGTALAIAMASVGILLNVSKYRRNE